MSPGYPGTRFLNLTGQRTVHTYHTVGVYCSASTVPSDPPLSPGVQERPIEASVGVVFMTMTPSCAPENVRSLINASEIK